MSLKTFNYTNDKYIEAEDTRGQIIGIIGNAGCGFRGEVVRVGTTNNYTVKKGSVIFTGGLCSIVKSDETFDLTSYNYIVLKTTYNINTDEYSCNLEAVNSYTSEIVGDVQKYTVIFQKGVGVVNGLLSLNEKYISQIKLNGNKITASNGTVDFSAVGYVYLNGKAYLPEEDGTGCVYLKTATTEQGVKADSAIQGIVCGGLTSAVDSSKKATITKTQIALALGLTGQKIAVLKNGNWEAFQL